MKNYIKIFERIFVNYFASMGMSVLVIVLLNIPLKIVMGDNYNDLTEFFISMFSLIITMFVLFYIDGYRARKIELKSFLIAQLIQFILLVVIIFLIGRAIYISGPTDHLARYILYKVNPSLINGKVMLNRYCLLLMIGAYIFLYVPLMLVAEHLGVKRRDKQFKKHKK